MADKDALFAEVATALHQGWCGCDSWDGTNCDEYFESEFPDQAGAVMGVLRRMVPDLPAVRGDQP